MASDKPAAEAIPEIEAIGRAVDRLVLMSTLFDRARSADSAFAEEVSLLSDLRTLALGLAYSDQSYLRFRALRVLVRRFGGPGAARLLAIAQPIADEEFIVTLRRRTNEERLDGGFAAKHLQGDAEDAEILRLFTIHRKKGLSVSEAQMQALRDLGKISKGEEGAKKAITRARADARARGYIDPRAAIKVGVLGMPIEPQITLADLAKRGRPQKDAK